MIKVSVIVAAYNVAPYIEKCIESILNQTLKEIQVIVVNDGSTDSTYDKLKKISDQRLLYLEKVNGGLSDARNYGIDYSEGEFLAFVDGDDFCDVNMYECLYQEAVNNNLDLVECEYRMVYNDYSVIKIGKRDFTQNIKFYPSGSCNKLIRTSVIKKYGLKFLKGIWYEDYNFFTKLIPLLNNVGFVGKPFYNYVQRSGSIMHTVSKKITDVYKATSDIIEFYKKNNFYDLLKPDLEYLICREILLCSGLRCLEYDIENNARLVKDNYLYFNGEFPNWRNNKYLKKFTVENLCMRCMRKYNVRFILRFIKFFKYLKDNYIRKCR